MKRGFTLIEILVAVAILAIIAIMMMRGLQIVMKSKDRIEIAESDLEDLQVCFNILRQDFQQVVNRPVLDNNGQQQAAFFYQAQPLEIAFTRGGNGNPDNLERRSNLQRVSYRLEDKKFERVVWPVLDRVSTTPSDNRTLLQDVNSIQWQFVGDDQQLHSNPSGTLPSGVELTLTLHDGQTLKRLFALPEAQPVFPLLRGS